MNDDASLIAAFAANGSEQAFAQLVDRHIALVYSAALRQLGGDAHRAQDATQVVFCELAARAGRLKHHASLAGWLYSTSRFVAARLRRSEERRKGRETRFTMSNVADEEPENAWREIEPFIDEAMNELAERDRQAVILRFFQNQPLSSVG